MPEPIMVRISGPATLKRQIARAKKLYAKGVNVFLYIEDIEAVCKCHDPDTIAELIGSVPLYVKEPD